MRINPVLRGSPVPRALAAALLTAGALGATAGTATAGEPSVRAESRGGTVPGTVASPTPLAVREAPTSHAAAVQRLAPGAEDRVLCAVRGQSVNGNPYWYWLVGAQGWASAAFVDTHGRWVDHCADPCPEWKDGHWTNWDGVVG
ncbi:SH3 domain-containing protein [Streptomyces fumanus]|uniref:SH3 domain-containing protein n=1 Tax=Streptomyces fumanus TaxID=67302 RepID=A0A919A7P0_9ACTN|nr:SH3 domain-containing protein [Streptomyces fumanus]GHE89524.1 hypothetical protein GCM10018772_11660 [Streptomyces fumanus]